MSVVGQSDVPGWVKILSRIDSLLKGDKVARVIGSEVGLSVLDEAMMIDGVGGFAPADRTSGMCLGTAGMHEVNRNVAAAGDPEVLEAKMRTNSARGLRTRIEYVMQLQSGQHHHCIVDGDSTLFNHLALSKANSNLAMPRRLRNVDDAKLN